jgi:hypothetical protein
MAILHRIRAYLYDNLLTNNPSELLVVIPALPAGEYVVEVVRSTRQVFCLKSQEQQPLGKYSPCNKNYCLPISPDIDRCYRAI